MIAPTAAPRRDLNSRAETADASKETRASRDEQLPLAPPTRAASADANFPFPSENLWA
jgi:hypothetical protein